MSQIKNILRLSVILVIIAALTFILAACSNDDDNTDNSSGVTVLMLHVGNDYSANTISSPTGNRVTPPLKDGYDFLGYFTSDGIKYFESDGSQVQGMLIDSSISLYAKFESHSYKLIADAGEGTFSDGGFAKELSVKLGEQISVPTPTPNEDQYLFDAWVSESGKRLEYSGGRIILSADELDENGNIKIYAQYKLREFTLTLNYNDGLTPPKEVKVKWGDSIANLSEYYIQGDGRDVVGFSSLSYTEATYDETVSGDLTLFAVWKMYKTVEFVYPAGKIEEIKVYYTSGTSATLPENVRVPGFDLEGWYDNAIYSGAPITNVPGGAIADKYFGKWIMAKYEISFDTGTDDSTENMTYYYGDTFELPTLQRVGFTFEGWRESGADAPIFSLSAEHWGDLSLTAVWTPVSYVINLNCLGGTSPTTFAEVRYGDSYTLPVPTRDGYTFRGWYSGDDRYTDAHGNCLAPWTVAENIDLNALWEIATFTVKYESNGGTAVALQRYKYGETLVFPKDPRKTDGLFRGWYDEALTTEYTPLTAVTSDMTLYAAYVESTPISTPEDFYNIKNNPSGNYHLINDINLRGDNVAPMPEFKGVLNGQGYKIHNFAMNTSAAYVGLFSVNSGLIRNLVIENCNINATCNFDRYNTSNYDWLTATHQTEYGVFAGRNNGTIIGCTVLNSTLKATVTTSARHKGDDDIYSGTSLSGTYIIGGFVGTLTGSGKMYFCENNATVTVTGTNSESGDAAAHTVIHCGGIVGHSSSGSIIANCTNNADVTVNSATHGYRESSSGTNYDNSAWSLSNNVGGIVGTNNGTVIRSVSSAKIYSKTSESLSGAVIASTNETLVAAIAGRNSGIIIACVSRGDVTGSSAKTLCIGGIAGYSPGNITDCLAYSNVTGVSSNRPFVGGIVGENSGTLKTSYFVGSVTSTISGAYVGGILGINDNSGSVMSCVSLGSVSAVSGNSHLAIGSVSGISNGNLYDSAAEYLVSGNPATPGARNGVEAATHEQLTTESFYHEVLYWETKNWVIENGKLPYLSWYGEIITETDEGAEA